MKRRPPAREVPPSLTRGDWARRFALGIAAWALPVIVVWSALAPWYNRFLETAAERLVRWSETPATSHLVPKDDDFVLLTRDDAATSKGFLYSIRVTDVHFNWLMLATFCLAVPAVPWRHRLENFGWATLILVFFHIVSLFLYVKFAYATQLGQWSLDHYPQAWKRETWGMAKHVFDLPLKFAMPFVLWGAFYARQLLPEASADL